MRSRSPVALMLAVCLQTHVPAQPIEPIRIVPAVQTPGNPAPAIHEQRSLSLPELESMAIANSPVLAQAQARIEAARGRWQQAGLYPNPEVGYVASEIGNEGQAGQQGAYAAQEFVRGGKLALNQQASAQEVTRASQQYGAQRLRVINDTRREFYNVLVAQESLRLTAELLGIAEKATGASEQLLRAEETTRVDVLQARVELDNARLALSNAEYRHATAWRRLAAVAGAPQMAPMRVAGDLHAAIPELTWENALARLIAESPEIAAAQADAERAAWALRRACVEPIPNVDVQTSVQYDDASQDTVAGLQVGIPLPIFDRNQGNVRQARADLIAAQCELSRLQLELQERLANVFERYAVAHRQVRTYSESIIPNAEQSLELTVRGYQAGEFSFLSYLTAQRTYSQANLAYLSALNELWSSATEIDGLLLTGSLKAPQPE